MISSMMALEDALLVASVMRLLSRERCAGDSQWLQIASAVAVRNPTAGPPDKAPRSPHADRNVRLRLCFDFG